MPGRLSGHPAVCYTDNNRSGGRLPGDRGMTSLIRDLSSLVLPSLLILPCGCGTPGRIPGGEYLIIDLVDEFGLDQPGESWVFASPDRWSIRTEGQRRFLYLAPGSAADASPTGPLETALHHKYRFRNFSFSCRVHLDRAAGGRSCDAAILFGYQDGSNGLRLDLKRLSGTVDVSLVRLDGGRLSRLASNPPASPYAGREDWHQIGILRNLETRTIDVYVDDGDQPLLRTRTDAYEWGMIGLASSSGGAAFGRVMISGEATPAR